MYRYMQTHAKPHTLMESQMHAWTDAHIIIRVDTAVDKCTTDIGNFTLRFADVLDSIPIPHMRMRSREFVSRGLGTRPETCFSDILPRPPPKSSLSHCHHPRNSTNKHCSLGSSTQNRARSIPYRLVRATEPALCRCRLSSGSRFSSFSAASIYFQLAYA